MSYSDKKFSNIFIIVLTLIFCFDVFLWLEIFKEPRNPELDFLNVGQGDAILLKFPFSGEILIDSGDGQQIKTALSQVQTYFHRDIDVWILSHANIDHYGGFLKLLETNPPRIFIYNGFDSQGESFQALKKSLQEKGIPIVILAAGDKIKIGDSHFDILWPINPSPKNDLNDNSLVLRLMSRNHSVLFVGDISSKTLASLDNIQSEILKVSHHGSKTGTNNQVLEVVKPRIALIGVGLNNRYGHPSPEVIDLLQKIGSQILRTDFNRTIKIIFDNNLLIKTQ